MVMSTDALNASIETKFAFKIHAMVGFVCVGMCHRETVKTHGFKNDYSVAGKGTWICSYAS